MVWGRGGGRGEKTNSNLGEKESYLDHLWFSKRGGTRNMTVSRKFTGGVLGERKRDGNKLG